MNNDSAVTRRDFLKKSAKTGAGLAALGGITLITEPERVFGAGDRVQVAIIGLNGRGSDHMKELSRLANAQIAALCDVDSRVLDKRLVQMDKLGLPKPKTYADIRRLLDDELKWVKFSNASWTHDGKGFFYSRYDQPTPGVTFQSLNLNQKLYYHKLGTPQSEDKLVYAPTEAKWGVGGQGRS